VVRRHVAGEEGGQSGRVLHHGHVAVPDEVLHQGLELLVTDDFPYLVVDVPDLVLASTPPLPNPVAGTELRAS